MELSTSNSDERLSFDKLIHCTHCNEVNNMITKYGNDMFVNFLSCPVGDHHEKLKKYLAEEQGVIWYGIVPNLPDHNVVSLSRYAQYPACQKGSRYGPFSFEIDVNAVFARYCEIHAVSSVQDLFFYYVEKNYKQERSQIIVVSTIPIDGLEGFYFDRSPCTWKQEGEVVTWEWLCPGFHEYQKYSNPTHYQLEFAFVFPKQDEGFSFVVGRDAANAEIECLVTSNPHEEASICIPFQNKWSPDRKALSCIMKRNRYDRNRLRSISEAAKLYHLDPDSPTIMSDVNLAICLCGGCNNPQYSLDKIGVQTKEFADRILEYIFG